jgi:CO dehydrogenase/acetyl-CoA synthase beta subunit
VFAEWEEEEGEEEEEEEEEEVVVAAAAARATHFAEIKNSFIFKREFVALDALQVLSLRALLVQKYKY